MRTCWANQNFGWGVLMTAAFMAGCIDPSMLESKKTAKTDEAAAPGAPAAAPAAPNPGGGAASLPMDNTKLVDKKAALAANPALIETQNRINASDPVSAAAQGYFAIGSKAQMLNLQNQINVIKADNNNKPPSFAQFEDLLRQNGVQLKGIYRWQVYAYDDEKGDIVILEDHAMKKAEYEKGGLKLD
ncbi:hypothetical protein SH661x_003768 [Planctomicrobium sp. SH661]|uniref:hypothetical protein n=1 Tax=Planctomicrobium sp. SH661 TaxID=3448124 RepID=UPI003F5C4441